MNADTVTEAVEKALSSSQHGLMQALHQRLTVDEEQRLTLISTIQNLEQRLKHCKFSAWINEPEAQSTNKCVKPHRQRVTKSYFMKKLLATPSPKLDWRILVFREWI